MYALVYVTVQGEFKRNAENQMDISFYVKCVFSMFTEQGMFSSFKFKRVLVRRKNDKIRCRTENTTTKTKQKFLLLQTFHHKKYFGNVYDWFVTVFKRNQI